MCVWIAYRSKRKDGIINIAIHLCACTASFHSFLSLITVEASEAASHHVRCAAFVHFLLGSAAVKDAVERERVRDSRHDDFRALFVHALATAGNTRGIIKRWVKRHRRGQDFIGKAFMSYKRCRRVLNHYRFAILNIVPFGIFKSC